MRGDLWAIVFALCSAMCMALGAVIRQRATTTDVGAARPVLAQPAWWAGVLVGLGGFGFQAIALSAGPLLLVQPLLVTSLLFMLPLAMVMYGVRPAKAQLGWSAVLTVAVGLLLVLGNPTPGGGHVSSQIRLLAVCVCLAIGIGAAIAARRFPGNLRAMILGGASGALFGGAAMLTKQLTVHLHHRGIGAAVLSWELPTLLAVAAAAVLLQQLSYGAGQLHASFPAALVTEQVVAAGLGIVVLGEQIASGGLLRSVLLLLAVIVGVAAVRLALADRSDTEALDAPQVSSR